MNARRCPECQGVARWVESRSDSYRGVPGGAEHWYQCERGHRFVIEGVGRLIFAVVASSVLGAIGANLFATGSRLGGGAFIAASVGMLGQQAWKWRLRSRTKR